MEEDPLCECGCGSRVTRHATGRWNRFLYGHHWRGRNRSPSHNENMTDALRRHYGEHRQTAPTFEPGPTHPNWRSGRSSSTYRRIAFETYPHMCDVCGKDSGYLLIHHRDENHDNSDVNNLQVLCMSCHVKEHVRRRTLGESRCEIDGKAVYD